MGKDWKPGLRNIAGGNYFRQDPETDLTHQPTPIMPLSWIALNSVKGLGPVRIKALLDRFGTPEAVFKESPQSLSTVDGIGSESIGNLHNSELFRNAQRQIDLARAQNAHILTLAQSDYPPMLKEIFAPPPVLFVKGQLDAFRRSALAIVGTRQPTPYGRSATAHIVRGLVQHKLSIVSGLALGVDTVAHETCLDEGGCTIAVLGCGIDYIYPASNTRLAQRICESGALVSEFPFATPPETFNFPRRNRIISGLSSGTIVIEAGEKSGALITSHYALQQGREVFAVPGSIFSDKSRGPHALIRNGAIPVGSAREIIEAVKLSLQPSLFGNAAPSFERLAPQLLSAPERDIIGLFDQEPLRIDQLAEKTGKAINEVMGVLLNLELKGCVRQLAGQQFVRV